METTLTSEVEPAPSKLGRRPESEPLNDEELAVRDEVLALLSPQSAAERRSSTEKRTATELACRAAVAPAPT